MNDELEVDTDHLIASLSYLEPKVIDWMDWWQLGTGKRFGK